MGFTIYTQDGKRGIESQNRYGGVYLEQNKLKGSPLDKNNTRDTGCS